MFQALTWHYPVIEKRTLIANSPITYILEEITIKNFYKRFSQLHPDYVRGFRLFSDNHLLQDYSLVHVTPDNVI